MQWHAIWAEVNHLIRNRTGTPVQFLFHKESAKEPGRNPVSITNPTPQEESESK